jgi:diadenylate cyclase
MIDTLFEYFRGRSVLGLGLDILDILVVAAIAYAVLLVLRGTRAMQIGLGLGIVFLLYLVAQWLQLVTLLSVMGSLVTSIILVIVVVFQNDIRRGLERVGSSAWLSFTRSQESQVIDEVVNAATELAKHRIGAIIAFEQDANLDEFVGAHKGHVLDAKVSDELLVALFLPEGLNKLHDGAVIIRNLRVAKAGVFFPMPERSLDSSFGSRHRAALGITEETDAVVVIVSEERGTISFCFNGNIASNLDGPKLKTMLEAIFSPKVRKKSRRALALRRSLLPQAPSSARAPETLPEALPTPRVSEPPKPPQEQEGAPESAPRSTTLDFQQPASLKRRSDSLPPPPLKANVEPDAPRTSQVGVTLLSEAHPMPRVELGDRPTPTVDTRDKDADTERQE